MGHEVAGSLNHLVRMVSDSGKSPAQSQSFLGYLVQQAAGVEPTGSSATKAKYRRLQRELGIAAPADFASMTSVVRRLDWESAREVDEFNAT